MDYFPFALKWILRPDVEGGYSNNPDDPGGATNHGVTQAVYDSYRAALGQASQDVRAIGNDEVASIYRDRYWDAENCIALPPKTAICVFDFAVNSGDGVAAKHLQKVLGFGEQDQDGKIGPKTAAAALGLGDGALADAYLADHRAFYEECIIKKPRLATFEHGWLNRITNLHAFINTTAFVA